MYMTSFSLENVPWKIYFQCHRYRCTYFNSVARESITWLYTNAFNHSLTDYHLKYFQIFTITNNTIKNITICAFLCT